MLSKQGRSALLLVFAAIALSACASTSSTDPGLSDKWRISVTGNAKAAGKVKLVVRNAKGRLARLAIAIPAETPENDVAKRIRDEVKLALPSSGYEVEIDDGEDVLVKSLKGTEQFSVQLRGNTVMGVEMKVGLD